MVRDMEVVLDEWTRTVKEHPSDISPLECQRQKKKLRKWLKQGKMRIKLDAQMKWRLCAARLMREQFDKPWCWKWHEYRSEHALNMYKYGHQWQRFNGTMARAWEGGNENMRVLAEQGIGDEIMYASTYERLLRDCPDATIEVDGRLLPLMRRSFPEANFVSRWIHGCDETRQTPSPEDYDKLKIAFSSHILSADLLGRYTKSSPSGQPYLLTDTSRVEYYKEILRKLGDPPYIGITWRGGRSNNTPEELRKQEGTYVSLQYKRKEHNGNCWVIGSEPGNDWIHDVSLDHNDVDDVAALVQALDFVNSTQNYIIHVCGALGTKCHVVKPPHQFGPVGDDASENNRLKWNYGLRRQHPWYNSVKVYQNYKEFQNE